jgi:hypothetical protein
MDLAACLFLLRMIDEVVHIALQCPIAARGVGIEPTARLDGEVRCLLHRLHGKIPGRLHDDKSLPADPGDDRWSVFIVMPPAGLALLAAAARAASQRLLPTLLGLPLVSSSMVEVVRFYGAFELAEHLIGQRGIAQPPTPAIAGPDMDAQLPGNTTRRT